MVVACSALFVALGGLAAGAVIITSNSQVAKDTISGGTSILRTGTTTVQVDFNVVADGRVPKSCFVYGTATRAT